MRRFMILLPFTAVAAPAHAAGEGPFFSLGNSDFTVLIAFLLFVGVLVYFKVPALLTGFLDKRAAAISSDLETARALRDEAKAVLASYDRKLKEAKEQVQRIVQNAERDAHAAADAAKDDLKATIERRLKKAEEQIASAEEAAVRAVRERAISVAITAAADVLTEQMTAESAGTLIDSAINEVGQRLN